jgi:murein L,D-transpeptidase YcbB/YkuD
MAMEVRRATPQWPALLLVALILPDACDPEPRGEPNARVREIIAASGSPVLQLPTGDTLHISEPIAQFYRDRGFRTAWTDYDEVLDRGLALLETMGRSGGDGFDPEEYRYPLASRMLMQVEEDSLEERDEPGQMGVVDIVLSEVFSRYAQHLTGGALDPRVAGLDWQIEREEPDVRRLLDSLLDGTRPDVLVDSVRPEPPEYRLMMRALARYREIERAGGWQAVPDGKLPEIGGSSALAGALRQRLVAERDPDEVALAQRGQARPDVFDEGLRDALAHFQARHGLDGDGKLGKLTLAELNEPVATRIAELKLNMDRWRWLPRDLGDLYIMVNVAGFELDVVENDSSLMTMNVVVGKDAWRTPIFRDTMEHIVINPYWNVPPNIQRDEVIPALLRDPGYLESHNMEVLVGNRRISPAEIDPGRVRAGSSPYHIRQLPGGDNALGEVKFLFPNKDDIYLHDTPARSLFTQSSRAFSHGCIRVEKPVELAKLIMAKATNRPSEDYETLRARSGEQWINLNRPVPVYILYFTAYAHRDGSVSFHPDIYERDARLGEIVAD